MGFSLFPPGQLASSRFFPSPNSESVVFALAPPFSRPFFSVPSERERVSPAMADSTISLLLDAEKEAQRVVETARRGMSLNASNKHKHTNELTKKTENTK